MRLASCFSFDSFVFSFLPLRLLSLLLLGLSFFLTSHVIKPLFRCDIPFILLIRCVCFSASWSSLFHFLSVSSSFSLFCFFFVHVLLLLLCPLPSHFVPPLAFFVLSFLCSFLFFRPRPLCILRPFFPTLRLFSFSATFSFFMLLLRQSFLLLDTWFVSVSLFAFSVSFFFPPSSPSHPSCHPCVLIGALSSSFVPTFFLLGPSLAPPSPPSRHIFCPSLLL